MSEHCGTGLHNMASVTPRTRTVVVVLNYNGGTLLKDCLEGLTHQTDCDGGFCVVVIDNGSTDASLGNARGNFPGICFIENRTNLGFAGGCNRGFDWALERNTEYVALLNMDAVPAEDWLQQLVRAMDMHSNAAIAGSMLLSSDGKYVEFDGRQFDPVTTAGGYADRPLGDEPKGVRKSGYACGGAMIVRMAAIEDIGGFDPAYFAYHEDVELCVRAWRAGYEVVHVPTAIVRHRRGGANVGGAFNHFSGTRNMLLALACHYDQTSWAANREKLTDFFLGSHEPVRRQAIISAFFALPDVILARRAFSEGSARRGYSKCFPPPFEPGANRSDEQA